MDSRPSSSPISSQKALLEKGYRNKQRKLVTQNKNVYDDGDEQLQKIILLGFNGDGKFLVDDNRRLTR